jgi:hypothetical protein
MELDGCSRLFNYAANYPACITLSHSHHFSQNFSENHHSLSKYILRVKSAETYSIKMITTIFINNHCIREHLIQLKTLGTMQYFVNRKFLKNSKFYSFGQKECSLKFNKF